MSDGKVTKLLNGVKSMIGGSKEKWVDMLHH